MQLAEIRLPIDVEARDILLLNARILLNDEFRNQISKDPKILTRYLNIPDDVISKIDIALPEKPSEEFQHLLKMVLKDCVERGLVGIEEFEYSIADVENYIGLLAAVVLVVALWIWVVVY